MTLWRPCLFHPFFIDSMSVLIAILLCLLIGRGDVMVEAILDGLQLGGSDRFKIIGDDCNI